MRATVMYGAGDVRVENVRDPTLQGPTDAVVRVLRSRSAGGLSVSPTRRRSRSRVLAATGSVIDDLMGHEGGRMERGVSPMGALYRETTPEMLTRATAAIEDRLAIALKVAARLLPEVRSDAERRARKDAS